MTRKLTWLRRNIATAFGYFWLPCPMCGQMFAGFEIGRRSVPTEEPSHGRCCCKWCD